MTPLALYDDRRSTHVSLDAMDWVWTNSHSKGVARLVMLAIADKVKGPDCKAFAGLTFLQGRANAGRSTVIGAVRDLTESGELEAVEGETGPYGAAMYHLPKAVGHVRGDSSQGRKSVQKLHRSGGIGISANGAGSEPNQSVPGDETGAETEPIDSPASLQAGAESAPNETGSAPEISAETAPISNQRQAPIGAESGQQSVQNLDPIGAETAPPIHQTPKEHQEPLFSADVVALPNQRAGKPRESNTKPTAQTFIAEWLAMCAKDDQPTQDIVKRIGRELRTLIEQNARAEDISAGLAAWDVDGNSPTSLPSFVNGARNRRRRAERGTSAQPRQSMPTVDQRVLGAMEAAQRLEARRGLPSAGPPGASIATVTHLPTTRGLAS